MAVLAAGAAPLRLAVTVLVGAAVGAAGRLLLQDARTPSERNVFVTGAVLLLGGAGAYLGTSPLLSGFAAAIAWRWDGDEASHLTIRDVGVLRHPLVALLLVFAGASVRRNEAVLWLTASIALLGLLGKLVSAFAFSRRFGVSPTAFTAVMLQPGVLAIALAFNAGQLLGHAYQDVVSAFTVAWSIWVIAATFLPADGAVERV
ncbi:MAG: hypothetical protein EHM88_23230 [Candidatus Rokuibacteriota bacterium]|nr:MAG: hypothetical protein EHM88_23230 [Candidatus Rokubacteria bacterium]